MGGCFMLPPFAHLVACCCMLLRFVAYCCMLLHVVGCCCAKFETGQTFSTVQTGATLLANKSWRCWELLRPFARNLKQLEHSF